MAEIDYSLHIAVIRDRLVERAAQNAPQWHVPQMPVTQSNAGCLIVGQLLEKLPTEDASALASAIVSEQNSDGSWSEFPRSEGDLSLTLEVVQALSLTKSAPIEEALCKAILWMESHREEFVIRPDTLLLLGAVTDITPPDSRSLRARFRKLLRRIPIFSAHVNNPLSYQPMLDVLSKSRTSALGKSHDLLRFQRGDGSWNGSTRSTVLALIALRHTGLPQDDTAFERGWRFLRSQQEWSDKGLVQNSCDLSNLMHATAVRALVIAGAEEQHLTGSVLSLLHTARGHGGWGLGGSLPTDLFSTAIALDALSLIGDIPLETTWSRRRGVYMLVRSQRADGGWPLYPVRKTLLSRFSRKTRSSVEVTALVLQALTFNEGFEPDEKAVQKRGLRFLLKRQAKNGLWSGDVTDSVLFASSRVIESLSVVPHPNLPVLHKAVNALVKCQNEDGGWGEAVGAEEFTVAESNPLHTAWVLRGLQTVPQVPIEAVYKARRYLERTLDNSGLIWNTATLAMSLPFGEHRIGLSDLTTMWALEAWAPLGDTTRSHQHQSRRARGIFEGNK